MGSRCASSEFRVRHDNIHNRHAKPIHDNRNTNLSYMVSNYTSEILLSLRFHTGTRLTPELGGVVLKCTTMVHPVKE